MTIRKLIKYLKLLTFLGFISFIGYQGYHFYQGISQPHKQIPIIEDINSAVGDKIDELNEDPIEKPLYWQDITVDKIPNSFVVQGIYQPECNENNTTLGDTYVGCGDKLEDVVPNNDLHAFFGVGKVYDEKNNDITTQISIDYGSVNVYQPVKQQTTLYLKDKNSGATLIKKEVTIEVKIEGYLTEKDTIVEKGGFKYRLSPILSVKDAILVNYTGADTNVIIPKTFDMYGNTYKITEIGDSAFAEKGLEEVKIPNTIIKIGENAFSRNKLSKIKLPNSVTEIGGEAFAYNNLTSVEIPLSVKEIQSDAFSDNKINYLILPDSKVEIGMNAFRNNDLSSVEVSDKINLYSAGKKSPIEVFDGNTEIVFIINGENVVDNKQFHYQINPIKGTVSIYGFAEGQETPDVVIPETLYIKGTPYIVDFVGNFSSSDIKTLILPDTLKEIDSHAFSDNQITEIEIPESVEIIGSSAFVNNQLSHVNFSNSLREIGEEAFKDNHLTEVVLPLHTTYAYEVYVYNSFDDNVQVTTK